MKNKLIVSVTLLIVTIICTSVATYAYFTAIFEYDEVSLVNISSAELPIITVVSQETISLFISNEIMAESNASSTKIAVSNYIDDAIKINATTSDTGGYSEVMYEVYYNPTVAYEKSDLNINKDKELVLSIYSKITDNDLLEYDLTDLTERTLIYEGIFSVKGVNTTIEEVLSVELGFYNQVFNQDDNAGITISGNLEFELVGVTYTID